MSLLDFFKRKGGASVSSGGDRGVSEEHLQLRRAIERCDTYRIAKDAGQTVTLRELVTLLRRNNFSPAVIKQAIDESWGEVVPEELLR